MYMIREVMNCKPGKVGEMVKKFKALAAAMERVGQRPFRIYTDVSGPQFWTVVLEMEAESLDAHREMENQSMQDEEFQAIMADYHDLVISGKREIYTVEL